jgi:putative SOS response-associated peptidase YedK
MDSDGTAIADIHHRMPVFLDQSTIKLWLDPNVSFQNVLHSILSSKAIKAEHIDFYEVSSHVNSIRN